MAGFRFSPYFSRAASKCRFYMLMSPTSRPDAPHRLVAIGKKRLPKARAASCFAICTHKIRLRLVLLTCICVLTPEACPKSVASRPATLQNTS